MRDSSTNFYNIDKSHPKQLIPTTVNKPSFLLQVDDIPGTTMTIQEPEQKSINLQQPDSQIHYNPSIKVQKSSIFLMNSPNL